LGARGENDFKLVQMNLERIWRKEIQKKKRKGQALLGQPRFPFGPASDPACLPSPSPSRARTRLAPPGAGHVAAVRRRWTRRGRPPTPPGRDAGAGSQTISPVLSPAPSFSFLLRSHRAAAAAPPRAIAGESSAARRRPHQSLKLDAESTRALAVARVSSCERSTEVRVRRAP
jgi:hypothetical protein